jgi:hypothetical protein
MRVFDIVALALVSGADAFKITEHDKLAALGIANVGIDVAKNGYPNPGQCTLKNVAVRREWYVLTRSLHLKYIHLTCVFSGQCSQSRRGGTISMPSSASTPNQPLHQLPSRLEQGAALMTLS